MSLIVTHELRTPIPVVAQVSSYPSLKIQLQYNVAGGLTGIRHEVDLASDVDPSKVVRVSERAIGQLLQIIEFFYGFPPEIGQQRVEVAQSKCAATCSVGFATATFGAVIVGKVRLPEEAVLTRTSPRLAALLHLFNAARPPAADAEAVRLYYLVWEDLHGTPPRNGAILPEERLKYARDFVSHGCVLDRNQDAITFIELRIGKPLTAFDPMDPQHVVFVSSQRAEGRALIEAELKKAMW